MRGGPADRPEGPTAKIAPRRLPKASSDQSLRGGKCSRAASHASIRTRKQIGAGVAADRGRPPQSPQAPTVLADRWGEIHGPYTPHIRGGTLNTDAAQPAGRIATVHGHYTIAGEGYWRQKASKIGRRQGGQAGTPPRSPVRGRSWAAMGTRNWEHERRTHHSGSNRGGMPARRTRLRAGPHRPLETGQG